MDSIQHNYYHINTNSNNTLYIHWLIPQNIQNSLHNNQYNFILRDMYVLDIWFANKFLQLFPNHWDIHCYKLILHHLMLVYLEIHMYSMVPRRNRNLLDRNSYILYVDNNQYNRSYLHRHNIHLFLRNLLDKIIYIQCNHLKSKQRSEIHKHQYKRN